MVRIMIIKGSPNQITIIAALPMIVIIKTMKPIVIIEKRTIKPIILIIVFTIKEDKKAPISTKEGFVSSDILLQGSIRVERRSEMEKKL